MGTSSRAESTAAVRGARALRRGAPGLQAPPGDAGAHASSSCASSVPIARSASPAEPRALSRKVWGFSKLRPPGSPGAGVRRRGHSPRRPVRLGFPKYLSQPRFRASVIKYLFSFLPVSKFPLRAVPLVKTGHPLRPPHNK